MLTDETLHRIFYFSIIATIVAVVIGPTAEVTKDATKMATKKLVACDFEVFGIVQGKMNQIKNA